MSKAVDPDIVVTNSNVLFSCVVNDQLERVPVPRELIERAQGRQLYPGEAWALIAERLNEIRDGLVAACAAPIERGKLVEALDWANLLGPRK